MRHDMRGDKARIASTRRVVPVGVLASSRIIDRYHGTPKVPSLIDQSPTKFRETFGGLEMHNVQCLMLQQV